VCAHLCIHVLPRLLRSLLPRLLRSLFTGLFWHDSELWDNRPVRYFPTFQVFFSTFYFCYTSVITCMYRQEVRSHYLSTWVLFLLFTSFFYSNIYKLQGMRTSHTHTCDHRLLSTFRYKFRPLHSCVCYVHTEDIYAWFVVSNPYPSLHVFAFDFVLSLWW